MSDLMRVYLAGKISGSAGAWRDHLVYWSEDYDDVWSQTILQCSPGWDEDESWWEVLHEKVDVPFSDIPEWPIIPRGFLGIADYVGPYAVATSAVDEQKPHNTTTDLPDHLAGRKTPERGLILDRCFRAIDAADVVIAVATTPSPGTLCELGYAHARKRPIFAFVRSGADFDWFPAAMCADVVELRDDPYFWSGVRHTLAAYTDNDKTEPAEHPHHGLYRSLARTADLPTYYKSRWWLNRRHRALELAGMKCQLCATAKDLSVHHNSYANIYREPDRDLCVLCEACHKTADLRRRANEKALVKVQ